MVTEVVDSDLARQWDKIAETYPEYSGDIFRTEGKTLTYEKLKENRGFMNAAIRMNYFFEGTKADRFFRADGTPRSPGELRLEDKDELAKWVQNEMRWFNNNEVYTGMTFLRVNEADQERKAAFCYLMHCHDRTGATWGGAAKALLQGGVMSPTTWLTVGTGGLGAGSKVASEGAKQAGKVALKEVFKQSAIGVVASGVKHAATHIGEKGAIREGGKLVAEGLMKKHIVGAAAEAGLVNAAQDYAFQKIEIGAKFSDGYSLTRGAGAMGMGAAFGAGMGGLGEVAFPVAGRATSWSARVAKNAAVDTWSGAKITAKATGRFAGEAARAAGRAGDKWVVEPMYQAGKAMGMSPHPGLNSNMGLPLGGLFNKASSDALPDYKPRIDPLKLWMRRNWKPWKLFTNWAPVSSMPMECRPIIRPVIEYADNLMKKNDLIQKIQSLQHEVLDAVDNGGDVKAVLDKFAKDNQANLSSFRTEIRELRKHVDDTYGKMMPNKDTGGRVAVPVDEIPANTFLRKKLAVGIHAFEHHKTGITRAQKTKLLEFLDDLDKTASSLEKGSAGKDGQVILDSVAKIQSGELTTSQFRESLTGISHANFLANNAKSRLTGNWPNTPDGQTDAAYNQWKESLERSIQSGYYNVEHYSTPVALNRKENFEKNWQNQILPFYTTIAEKAEDGSVKSVNWTDQNIPTFAAHLKEGFDIGFDHEILYIVDELARRRQQWKGKGTGPELSIMPPASSLKSAMEALGDSPRYKKFIDDVVGKVTDDNIGAPGAPRTTVPFLRFFQDNRPNRHLYTMMSYPYRYAARFTYNNLISVPGKNFFSNRLFYTPLKQAGAFVAGAKVFGADIDSASVKAAANIVWRELDKDGKPIESWAAVARRAAVRNFSGWTVNDISRAPIPIVGRLIPMPQLTKLGWVAAGSAGLIAFGKYTESEKIEAVGKLGTSTASYGMQLGANVTDNTVPLAVRVGLQKTFGESSIFSYFDLPHWGAKTDAFLDSTIRVDDDGLFSAAAAARWVGGRGPAGDIVEISRVKDALAAADQTQPPATTTPPSNPPAGGNPPAQQGQGGYVPGQVVPPGALPGGAQGGAAPGTTNPNAGAAAPGTPANPASPANPGAPSAGAAPGGNSGAAQPGATAPNPYDSVNLRSGWQSAKNLGNSAMNSLPLSDNSKENLSDVWNVAAKTTKGIGSFLYRFLDWAHCHPSGNALLGFLGGAAAAYMVPTALNFMGLGGIPVIGTLLKTVGVVAGFFIGMEITKTLACPKGVSTHVGQCGNCSFAPDALTEKQAAYTNFNPSEVLAFTQDHNGGMYVNDNQFVVMAGGPDFAYTSFDTLSPDQGNGHLPKEFKGIDVSDALVFKGQGYEKVELNSADKALVGMRHAAAPEYTLSA